MRLWPRLSVVPLVLGALIFASSAQAALLDARLGIPTAKKRTCQAGLASGKGIVRRSVTTTASGLVTAQLAPAGTRRGDWDLAIFSRRDGRVVAASAFRGMTERAEGVVANGEPLTLQACRRSGRARSARLTVTNTAIPDRAPSSKIRLVRIDVPDAGAAKRLESLGLDLTEHARPGFREALLYSAADDQALQKARLGYSVRIPDVIAADRQALRLSKRSAAGAGAGSSVPSGRTDYRHLADYSAEMKALAEQNPDLVKPITLPHPTLEGRPVEGIEITNHVGRSDGKPVFLQLGLHHAREWPSGEHAMEWAYEMVDGLRSGDQRVTDLLDRARVIVVPIVNPDGFNLTREASFDVPVGPVGLLAESLGAVEEFAYKRRNCRVKDGAVPAAGECGNYENRFLGVDPNRNYGGFWGGPGASTATDDDTYRGAGPFSEPESQNIKDLVSQRQVTTLITNHTYSDLVLRPPGIKSEGDPPDEGIYKALGDSMAAENGYTSEKSWELYDTTGTTEDWSYYATGGLGFTFEIGKAADGPTGNETLVGSGFHPPYPIGVIAEWNGKYPNGGGNREAYYKALESTVNPARHSVVSGRAPADATLRLRKEFTSYTSPVIQESGAIAAPQTFTDVLMSSIDVGPTRTFDWHINPSTRPFAQKSRTLGLPADTPASSQKIESASIVPPVQTFPIEITADGPKGAIGAWIDGADGDDWDLYLYEGDGIDPTKQVSSSAGSTADERLTYLSPAPGHYTLEARYYTATSGWTGAIDLYGEKSAISIPAQQETWTLTCERAGRVVASWQVSVERGQRVDAGNACRPGRSAPLSGPLPTPGIFPTPGSRPSARAARAALAGITRFRRSGRVVRFRQPFVLAGTARWTLTTRVKGRNVLLGTARAKVANPGTVNAKVRLNRTAMRLLRRGKLGTVVTTRLAPEGASALSVRVRRTLR